ncbi:unnamed protein product [Bursaphelenchus okinawaensis]|uniref:DNA sliding clamp PCNA n=1 Tax=Bursaphelenchus okinawaensis TaxID=465554 RepID=A0A811KTZ0_9BILA|nr:unnamed protein product [Bursaphelenchus okinawaensis]CAG9110671.1 unnamed protein product [Bursaphelenchus okinawaensis]
MFEAKLAESALLKKVIDAIKDLITDAPFDCTETALNLQSMDGSHVALVSLRLGVGIFDVYRCDRAVNLGLSLAHMSNALKCAKNDDSCLIRYDDEEGEGLTLTFEDNKGRKQDILVKLMDIDCEHLGVPDQKYSCIIEMPASEFARTVKDLTIYSDTVVINCTKEGIQFKASGEGGTNTVSFSSETNEDEEGDDRVSVDVKEPVKLSFSIKYLNQFAKAANISNRVRLSLAASVPVVVEYQIEEDGFLKFYLAPKIDDEADMEA